MFITPDAVFGRLKYICREPFFNMTLIQSISGIRGTIGGKPGEALTPYDIVKYTAAFGTWLMRQARTGKNAGLSLDAMHVYRAQWCMDL